MYSISRVDRQFGILLVLFVGTWLVAANSSADQIDLSLNVYYNDIYDTSSGGTWQLAAKADEFGLAGLVVPLSGIDYSDPANTVLVGPSGRVNGGDQAGFDLNVSYFSTFGHYQLVLSQVPLGAANPEQTVFYGVGSIVDPDGGVPNYTNQATDYPDATSVGPELTTLTDLTNAVWGNGDPMGDTDWDSAAILAEGVFAEGETPAFYSSSSFAATGQVFITVPGDPAVLGDRSGFIEASTVVRSNYVAPPGDFNGDGVVNLGDYTVWRESLGLAVTPVGSGLDVDGSGFVDAGDYDIWKMNFGAGSSPGSLHSNLSGTAVPEPSSAILALILSCAVGRLGYCRS
ncbi:dockerin type I domain-containing protein [Aeoliella mucimassa]|uniref:Dockerin domain-containing protein n=1 Tax=Aeoliella mucimassa TaxID=2527972 RepID=A0A518AJG9_9BACT|nr:dockerin type I domain-containing protein [Aeoliella mucimassa]QDU54878.1 hypothetical protein Pan181_10620 [Aeoliella mucimassa]